MSEISILGLRAARNNYPVKREEEFAVIVRIYFRYAPEKYAIEFWSKDSIITGHQVREDKTIAYFFELLHPPVQQCNN